MRITYSQPTYPAMTDRTDIGEDTREEVQGTLSDALLFFRGLFGGSTLCKGVEEER